MRRKNLLYKLRRRGIRCDTKRGIIELPYGEDPERAPQIKRLIKEYGFIIQTIIT